MKAMIPRPSRTRSRKACATRIGEIAFVMNTAAASSRLALAASLRPLGAIPALTKTRSKMWRSRRRRNAPLPVVVDVEMLGADVAAGLVGELFGAARAGIVAHRSDDMPAAGFQLRREPKRQPARRPHHQRPPIFHT